MLRTEKGFNLIKLLSQLKTSIMSGVCKHALKSLRPGMQNAFVIGIIVNSFNMKTIDATRTRCMNFILYLN